MSRHIEKVYTAHSQSEGAGFIVHRPFPSSSVSDERADPFLMLDELGPKEYKKGEFEGAPWHPHRGFDTVMYLKAGEGKHQDSMGNSGIVKAGDVQHMSAASGVIHDEGRDHPGGLLHGFQMWVNRPAARKMDPPSYQHLTKQSFPFQEIKPGLKVKIIAGELPGLPVKSPMKLVQPIMYCDVNIDGTDAEKITIPVPEEMATCLVYVYSGEGYIYGGGEKREIKRTSSIVLGKSGSNIEVQWKKGEEAQVLGFLVMCGKPIGEPIARRGPFVMNTREEVLTAMMEYQQGTLVKHKATEIVY